MKTPSAELFAVIHSYEVNETRLDDLPDILIVMANKFQKQEAEAYRSVQSLIKYVGMKEAI